MASDEELNSNLHNTHNRCSGDQHCIDCRMITFLQLIIIGRPAVYANMMPLERDRMRIVVASCRIAGVFIAVLAAMRFPEWPIGTSALYVSILCALGLQAWVIHTQKVKEAASLFILFALLVSSIGIWNRGGIHSPVGFGAVVVGWIAIRTHDRPLGIFWCTVTGLILCGFGVADVLSLLPEDKVAPEFRDLYTSQVVLLLFFAMFAVTFIAENLRTADIEELNEQKDILKSIQREKMHLEMQSQLNHLEHLASMGRLAAGTAHEINNPLSYVIGNVQVILKELTLAKGNWTTSIDAAKDVLKGAQNIQQVVKDLNTFSKDDDTYVALEISEILTETLKVAMHELRYRATVTTDFVELPLVLGSMTRLGQIFLNLLLNAAQAIPTGHASEHTVAIRTFRSSKTHIGVEIQDSGEGIARENLKRIRTPFFTTKPKGEGTGLGLAVIENILQALDGKMFIESKVNVGTKVTILLPIATPQNIPTPLFVPPRQKSPSAPKNEDPLNILIIDDDALVARVLNRLLSVHTVSVCIDGRKAKSHLHSDAVFDLILCDLMMPDITGMDIYDHVQTTCPSLLNCLVFISGGTFTQRAHDFVESGNVTILAKPIKIESLVRIVAEARQNFDEDVADSPTHSDGLIPAEMLPEASQALTEL